MGKIAIIGSGSWGTAVANLLAEENKEVCMYARDAEVVTNINTEHFNLKYLNHQKIAQNIVASGDVKEAIAGAEYIVMAVGLQSTREVLEALKPYYKKEQILVNLSKGIEEKTLKWPYEIFEDVLGELSYVSLSGPSHAEEVIQKRLTAVVIASFQADLLKKAQKLFTRKYFRVYANDDLAGVEISGACKNIIAIAVGMLDAKGYGDNAIAAVITRGIHEMYQLGQIKGSNFRTFAGLSGIGDLVVTCTSNHSRNRRFGYNIGSGFSIQESLDKIGSLVEGYAGCKSIYNLARANTIQMPIVNEIYNILYNNKDLDESIQDFMYKNLEDEF